MEIRSLFLRVHRLCPKELTWWKDGLCGDWVGIDHQTGDCYQGDKDTQAALIVEPGGKLIAEGTKDAPIVLPLNSLKASVNREIGGLIICGNAKNNQGVLNQQIEGGPRTKHGGNDDADNSGILRYVRVEFAGYPFQKIRKLMV